MNQVSEGDEAEPLANPAALASANASVRPDTTSDVGNSPAFDPASPKPRASSAAIQKNV